MPQEFLASFAVDIDEAGVTRLQTILQQNRDLANELAAAFDSACSSMLEFVRYAPGKDLKRVNNPVCIAACLKDELAPAAKTKALARGLPKVTVKDYDCGHFAIYFDEFFEEASRDYIAFFDSVLRRTQPGH